MLYDGGRILAAPGSTVYMPEASIAQLAIDIVGRIAILRENQHLIILVRLIQQFLQAIEFLVSLWVPLVAKQNHLDNLLAVLTQMLFEGTLEIGWIDPRHIVLHGEYVVIILGLLHIHLHVCWYVYQAVASLEVFLVIVM